MSERDIAGRRLWGVLARFGGADELISAAEQLREAGYANLEAFTPFPVDNLDRPLRLKRSPMPGIILAGGLIGGGSVYALEFWINLSAYPLNIGGRPLHSWPSFIPPAFEGTVLIASLFAIVGVILVCGLPRLHHPVFEIEEFKRASTDGFFLAIRTDSGELDESAASDQFREAGAVDVWEVPDV